MCVFVIFFVEETKGATLEDMDILFGLVTEEQRRADVDHIFSQGGRAAGRRAPRGRAG